MTMKTSLLLAALGVTLAGLASTASPAAQNSGAPQAQGRGAARGTAAAPAPPTAPPPGSPGTYKVDADLMAVLKKAIEAAPDMSTSAVANTDQYRINIVRRGKGAGAIAHPGNTEVHYIIDGSATFVTGGTIVRPTSPGAVAEIQGGVSRHVSKGDVVVIPENSPHWYKDVDGSITYLEVRFVAPAK
jgi:mannose-6-phosphate isomerase-like protein (cupin superfamily)